MTRNQEVVYLTTGNRARGEVQNYHRKPSPLKLNKAFGNDIKGLKKKKEIISVFGDTDEVESKFTIGFEIEKNRLSRGAVKEYPLFCGFERDASCGYEAVTHILPLIPAGKWRNKVFNMLHQAERIIDDRWSPSDKTCGGHISIGVDGMSGDEIREAIRGNAGIILALFRRRLNTKYCGANRRLQKSYQNHYNSWSQSWEYSSTGTHHKYQTALAKDECLEFRLPSKVESVKQLIRRYELFYEVVNFSINKPKGKHETLLNTIKPIVLSMYNGDEQKANSIIELARHFRKFILDGTISDEIEEFLR